ncbi:MAG: penicillin-binding protein activator LpoB [Planctomycetaceae bacterium]|nr:penicillin-binding protein activator LpoB [Planctomycetaceae bacterium]
MFKNPTNFCSRRQFLFGSVSVAASGLAVGFCGCNTPKGRIMNAKESDKVGSHKAGSEVFRPIVCETTQKLLGKAYSQPVAFQENDKFPQRRVCFVSLENKTNEELGDFKEQLFEIIDTQISESDAFTTISPRAIEGAMRTAGFRAEQLFLPENMAAFSTAMQKEGEPFEYMLFAKLTSGTTTDARNSQKDYMLTLEMVNVHSPEDRIKESAMIRKEYNRSLGAKLFSWTK